MLGRTLSSVAVALFIGWLAVPTGRAQAQNLEAGKSPSQLFAGTCNACHRSPRGLLKTVSAGSLPGFLRQHYTTSGDMAAQLSNFLIANGASDTRFRQGTDTKSGGGSDQVDRQGRRLRAGAPPDAARPDADGLPPEGRNVRRLSKRSKPGTEEVPSAREEPQKLEPAIDDKDKAEITKEVAVKPEPPKASTEGNTEAAKVEAPKERGGDTPAFRTDPAPHVPPTPPPAGSTEPTAAAFCTNAPIPGIRHNVCGCCDGFPRILENRPSNCGGDHWRSARAGKRFVWRRRARQRRLSLRLR